MKKEVEEEEEVFSWNNNSLLKIKAFITGIECWRNISVCRILGLILGTA